jgi:cob(I)alamin adenosyltransferase
MKIYTKTGDSGQTGLFGGPRVWKDDARIEAYGTVDELNAVLGWARTEVGSGDLDVLLGEFQHQLFAIGAELATPEPEKLGTKLTGEAQIASLEQAIDDWDAQLPPLKQFVLPGGSRGAAALHVARAVCRRAERRVVTLRRVAGEPVGEPVAIYLNRLGDLLFVLARAANHRAGSGDVPWQKPE